MSQVLRSGDQADITDTQLYTQLDRAYTYIHITWKNACQSDDEARRGRQEFHDVWNGQEQCEDIC